MAVLTPQLVTRAGTVIAYTAASGGGDQTPCFAGLFLIYKNTSGSPITVTVNIPSGRTYSTGVAVTSPSVTVPATTGERWIGPIDATFVDPSLGDPGGFVLLATKGTLAGITYSTTNVAGLTVAAVRLPQPGDAPEPDPEHLQQDRLRQRPGSVRRYQIDPPRKEPRRQAQETRPRVPLPALPRVPHHQRTTAASMTLLATLREGRELGAPFCCRLRFALEELLTRGQSEQCLKRGVRLPAKATSMCLAPSSITRS